MARTSRSLFWLLIVLAFAAAVLGGASALHKSFLEPSASPAINVLEREFIDVSRLSAEQKQRLERSLMAIKGGERYLNELHSSLWQIATLGFAGLAVGCLGCAVLAFRAGRDQAGQNAG
jgi:hypothetical protein